MAFSLTYSSLTTYFHNVATGRTKAGISPNQIASALGNILDRAASAAGPNPLQQTLGERLAAARSAQGTGRTYGYSGGWTPAWMSAYAGARLNTYA